MPLIKILQVHNPHPTDDDTICDFCDGEDFKNHELFGQNAHALVLHCYFDEFQVTNPLGSKTKRHKLGKNIFNNIFKKLCLCILKKTVRCFNQVTMA